MSSIKMVALRKHPFGTGEREAGEEYEATADESAILIALKWAEKVPARSSSSSSVKSTAAIASAASTESKPPVASKRVYQRRDMQAKD